MKKLVIFKTLLITIGLAVFIITATNTLNTFLIIFAYFVLLILTFVISLIVDFVKKTNQKLFISKILLVSILGLIIGIFATDLQKRFNQNTAEKFITRIEEYKKIHGKYPDENQIKIPKSVNGILIKDMQYIRNSEIYKSDYVIKYFDGFWDEKLYFSDSKKWYIDD